MSLESKNDHSSLKLEVARSLNIFANIFHINYMIDFSSRVLKDMKTKKEAIVTRN